MKKVVFALTVLFGIFAALGHSGRTDANGGHYDRKNGGYHYHRTPPSQNAPSSERSLPRTYPLSTAAPQPVRTIQQVVKPTNQTDDLERLKKENELLRKENQDLRRLLANGGTAPASVVPSTSTQSVPTPSNSSVSSPSNAPQASKWTISSTGKRHNSSCRYFGSGKPCGSKDGVACKICGG